jgi:sporulation protein YlmC with PRC-barrel domain
MAHYGSLETQRVSDDVRDIRATTVRGSKGEKLGTVDDVIFDHDTMEIRYLIVDSDGWLEAGTFLLPADRVSGDENHEDGLATEVTQEQIEDSPQFDKKSLDTDKAWKKFEQLFKKYWEEAPVMHMKGSDRIITPPEEPAPAQASSAGGASRGSGSLVDAAKLFPERITDVFSDPAPGAGKVTLRPKSVARAEEAAPGVTLLKPRWWEAFENYLRLNKDDIQAKCSQCSSKAA